MWTIKAFMAGKITFIECQIPKHQRWEKEKVYLYSICSGGWEEDDDTYSYINIRLEKEIKENEN